MVTDAQSANPVQVVGLGADGWDGLSAATQQVVRSAEVLFGSSRQLDLVPASSAQRVPWPSPLLPALPGLLDRYADRARCVLASGDPLFHGIGNTLVRLLGSDLVRVHPQPSSVSLACARLGWPVHDTPVINLVGRPVSTLHPAVQPGRKLLVLSSDGSTPAEVAALLNGRGYGSSTLTVLADLGSRQESRHAADAADWPSEPAAALHVLAVECRADPETPLLPRFPGLPDDAFVHDGQLTKRDVRVATLMRLAPCPGQLLWDVGAGAGSIAIEWMRTDPSNRAIAVEHRADRVSGIERNAANLGTPGLRIVPGAAPDALESLEPPDAVFIGGGATNPGVVQRCWQALRPGGRLVINAVTMESEVVVAQQHREHGGELVRIGVEHASPVGGFTGWRPAMRVTQWAVTKR